MRNITLEEIIKRKIKYIQDHPDSELRDMDEGYICGFSDMLADIGLSESEFTSKYIQVVSDHKSLIDSVMDGETQVPQFGKKAGYNNAVVEILSLLDTKYMFDSEM